MKKGLLIICMLSIIGLYAQEEQVIIPKEYDINTEEIEQPQTHRISRVDKLTDFSKEYEAMVKRGKELTTLLIEHDKLVKKGSMTKKQITAWKRDVIEAKLLSYRIDDFTYSYIKEGYSLIDLVSPNVLSDYYDFSKKLESSSQYAGF